jgi:hypothetical protein
VRSPNVVSALIAGVAALSSACGGSPAAGADAAAGAGSGSAGSAAGAAGGAAGGGEGGGGSAGSAAGAGGAAGAASTGDGAAGEGGAGSGGAGSGSLAFEPGELVYSVSLSITTAGVTRMLVLRNGTGTPVSVTSLDFAGADAASFVLEPAPTLPAMIVAGDALPIVVRFRPPANAAATTAYAARLVASGNATAGLFGLAMNVANTEPSLAAVVGTLGYAIDVGSTTTTLGTAAAPIGDEIAAPRFTRAHAGSVSVTPVARYSPFEAAPYGYYTGTAPNITRTVLGVMSKGAADNIANRTLLPPLDPGAVTSFDPGAASFGLYAESASNTASLGPDGRLYQEDALNDDQAGVLPVHRLRVYPMRNRAAQPVADTYVVACEEASNSDFQDYVFVVSNVKPAP